MHVLLFVHASYVWAVCVPGFKVPALRAALILSTCSQYYRGYVVQEFLYADFTDTHDILIHEFIHPLA